MFLKQHKDIFIKILLSSLSLLLCLILIFNAGFINCFAVAGVDDALFWILVAVMWACGITFATVDDAHIGADELYGAMDSGTKSLLDTKAQKLSHTSVLGSILLGFLEVEWSKITDAIINTFGDYQGLTGHILVNHSGLLQPNSLISWTIPGMSSNSVITAEIGNATLKYIGADIDNYPFSVPLNFSSKSQFGRAICLDDIGLSFWSIGGTLNKVSTLNDGISYLVPNSLKRSIYINFCSRDILNTDIWFKGRQITRNYVDIMEGTFTLNYVADGSNIWRGGYLGGEVAVSDSVCPDGIWTNKSWSDWINELIFGDSTSVDVCNPSIDVGTYPGNDIWHDGSINDDIAIGQPSIGIAVPTDLDDIDIGTLTPDTVRDISNTDIMDKDIVVDDTNTDTKPDVKPSNGTPSKVLPALSLPEILFKEKFPFCLPWDLYNLFSVLDAEPEAPKFVIPYKNNMLNIDEEYVIDFSEFENAAKVIRFFACAGFVLALILISRKMIGSE